MRPVFAANESMAFITRQAESGAGSVGDTGLHLVSPSGDEIPEDVAFSIGLNGYTSITHRPVGGTVTLLRGLRDRGKPQIRP